MTLNGPPAGFEGPSVHLLGFYSYYVLHNRNKSLLIKVKEENKKADLKLNIQKPKIMASGPITSWQIDGETIETVQTLFPWAPKSL